VFQRRPRQPYGAEDHPDAEQDSGQTRVIAECREGCTTTDRERCQGEEAAHAPTIGAGGGGRGTPYTAEAMPIDIDIAHVARLARLDLGPDELETYREQLGVILEHAARVQSLDTEGVEPTAHPLEMTNTFRDDEVRPSLDRDEVLAAAPEARDGYFVVPPAMDQD